MHTVGDVHHTLLLFCLPYSHEKIEATSKHVLPSENIFVTESSAFFPVGEKLIAL
jgi:hypothetical protein